MVAPLVLYEWQKSAMRLVAIDAHAQHAGLSIGQSLSDARALYPDLIAREIDHDFLAGVFNDVADWHSNTSPIVSVLTDLRPYGDLVLDITGVAHLFGGEITMLAGVVDRLADLSFAAQGAVGSSVGAAWALANFAPGKIAPEDPTPLLTDLPVAALRLTDKQVEGLRQMGLKRIGQLYGRNRRALAARFGSSLLVRLDQALGLHEERLVPRLPVPDRYAERKFGEPIGRIDDVMMTAKDLAHQIYTQLAEEGLGAQTFHLVLYRVDHKVTTLTVNAARATRDAAHIGRLFTNRIERLVEDFDAGFGIEAIRLLANSVSKVADIQSGVFETNDGAVDLDQLYDRLASRLGPHAILRSKNVNSHNPERAVVLEPVIARTDDDPEAASDPDKIRPLRLLPHPEQISVMAEIPDAPPARMEWRRVSYRFVKASGPERIGVEWWQIGEGSLTRDYYVAEDESGRRYWLFREGLYASETGTPRWFLHGFFA